ncbi:MAG: type II secretion system protein N, partial [Gammaproteobacteria bacterium]|nr:type II secretion system protein N [Gammaproteobacteria bacterium]
IGRLSVDFQLKLDQGSLQGAARLGSEGLEVLNDLEGTFPVTLLSGMLSSLPIIPAGMISLELDSVSFRGGKPVAAEGEITWSEAAISNPMALSLGELKIDLREEEGKTLGTLSDTGGPLEASGDFSISPEGAYIIDLKLAARDKTQQNLVQALAMMGKADADGRSRFKYSGQL